VAVVRADGIAVYVYRRTPLLEFLQVRRSAVAGEYEGSWQTVYGGIHPGETATQAALRELQEETSLTPLRLWQVEYLESFYFRPKDYVAIMPVFAVEVARDAVVTLNDEHDAVRWIQEAVLDNFFMWRTQREALHILLDTLRQTSESKRFMEIPLDRTP
jgi:8-oxo-dGTP pyrophosphatase MutT (NUDIX family)